MRLGCRSEQAQERPVSETMGVKSSRNRYGRGQRLRRRHWARMREALMVTGAVIVVGVRTDLVLQPAAARRLNFFL
jgi:hypothetical protein